jgi:hypothetical protein
MWSSGCRELLQGWSKVSKPKVFEAFSFPSSLSKQTAGLFDAVFIRSSSKSSLVRFRVDNRVESSLRCFPCVP